MGLSIVILAAGQGTRMKSSLPKVLHPVAGKPLLEHLVKTSLSLSPEQVIVIHGYKGELLQEALSAYDITWVKQTEQLGTGHAVQCALPGLKSGNQVLILYGDTPLISTHTLKQFCDTVQNTRSMGLMTAHLEDPASYGRILRNKHDAVVGIVEAKDATPEQLEITEINTGMYVVFAEHLKTWLPKLSNDNAQSEFYLTDIIRLAVADNIEIFTSEPEHLCEIQGANDCWQLAQLERAYQWRQAETFLKAGVTLLDPHRFDVRGKVTIGKDVVIDVNVVLEGNVTIGDGCRIGPNTVLKNVTLGDQVTIEAFCHLEEAIVANEAIIGPYARLRPGSQIAEQAKIGNFVEVKKSVIGPKSKVNHLSYIGDAELGDSVNIGAGTITCNYDGVHKSKTRIGNKVFVGSDTQLVAPLTVGDGAFIGAGSTITKDVPADKLTLSRAKQVTINNWQKPKKEDA